AERCVADEAQRLSSAGYGVRTGCVGASGHKIAKARPCRRRVRVERRGQHLFLGGSQVGDGCHRAPASPAVQFRPSIGTATCHLRGHRELTTSFFVVLEDRNPVTGGPTPRERKGGLATAACSEVTDRTAVL